MNSITVSLHGQLSYIKAQNNVQAIIMWKYLFLNLFNQQNRTGTNRVSAAEQPLTNNYFALEPRNKYNSQACTFLC